MHQSTRRWRAVRKGGAFTLIELLVVVTIIAVLMAILLSSLNRARGQARTALGAFRIAALTKAMLLYADDNGGLPPFIGRGWEDLPTDKDSMVWPTGSGTTVGQLKRLETWCVNEPDSVWFTPEANWPDHVGVRYGSLFVYTRFENLYRCPEFQRIPDGKKSQGQFNYTRSILGRKWYVSDIDPEASESASGFGAPGPIMKVSQIHSPAKMWMLLDESYLRHCASPDNVLDPPPPNSLFAGGWMANDCMNYYLADELGQYHRPMAYGLTASSTAEAIAQGNVSHYDGHVDLCRDALPGRSYDLVPAPATLETLANLMVVHVFAQRGLASPLAQQRPKPPPPTP